MGFDATAREAIRAPSQFNKARESVDWLHINGATYVGPNRSFDGGDERFRPDNVLISSRQANITMIVGRDCGGWAPTIETRMTVDERQHAHYRGC